MARTHSEWTRFIPEDEWKIYKRVIDETVAREIPFALGGAFAMATYLGYWRHTKDMDLYVLPENRERMIDVLHGEGYTDYFDVHPYDRRWIYRGTTEDCIVDIIWAMANQRSQIDCFWMSGPEIDVRGRRLKVVPIEALLYDKLFIMQRDRCDWPDICNLLYAAGPDLEWEKLLDRLGEDWPLAAGSLWVYRWIAPGNAQRLPAWVWERLSLPPMPEYATEELIKSRVDLLDTRPWFGPSLEQLQPAA